MITIVWDMKRKHPSMLVMEAAPCVVSVSWMLEGPHRNRILGESRNTVVHVMTMCHTDKCNMSQGDT